MSEEAARENEYYWKYTVIDNTDETVGVFSPDHVPVCFIQDVDNADRIAFLMELCSERNTIANIIKEAKGGDLHALNDVFDIIETLIEE